MSILTAKQRKMTPQAQVQTLVRIGRRAALHADHLDYLLAGYYPRCQPELIPDVRARSAAARVKAQAALDEIIAICEASDDLDLRRKARSVRGF